MNELIKYNNLSYLNNQVFNNLIYKDMPHIAFIEAVILGNIDGEIWVEKKGDKYLSFLILTKSEFCFLIGQPSNEIFKKYSNLIKQIKNHKISIFNSNLIKQNNSKKIPRLNYKLNHENINLTSEKLHHNYKITKINSNNIKKCIWGERMLAIYGSKRHLEKYNYAICLFNQLNNEIIAEAYSVIGKNKAEIGVVVNEKYHGQGLGSNLCKILITELVTNYDINIEIFWTCNQNNIASWKTAEKLGCKPLNKYNLFEII